MAAGRNEHILNIRLQFDKNVTGIDQMQKTVKDASTEMKEEIKSVRDSAKRGGEDTLRTMTDFKTSLNDLSQNLKNLDFVGAFHSLGGVLSSLLNRMGLLGKLILGLGGIIAATIVSAFGEQEKLVKAFAQLSAFGTGGRQDIGERVGTAMSRISDMAFQTMHNIDEVTDVYVQLAKARVRQHALAGQERSDIETLTKATLLTADALGTNVEQMGRFVSSLNVMGRVSAKDIAGPGGILRTFAAVQDVVGLVDEELSGVMTSVTEVARRMSAFGAASKDITAMANATAKLAGLFGELGLGAERAGEIMTSLFDPTRLRENSLLLNRMGMSMNEYMNMLAGGTVDELKMTKGLVDASKDILMMQQQGVNAFALQARAQQMGFKSAQEALLMAKQGDQILSDIEKRQAAGAADLEKQAAEGMSTFNDAWKRLVNVFQATLVKQLAPVIGFLTQALERINEWWIRNSESINDFFKKAIDGIVSFITNFDFKQVGEFFKGVKEALATAWTWAQKLAGAAKYLLIAFLAYKALGFLLPLFGGIAGIFSKLTGSMNKVSESATQAGGAFTGFGKALGGGLQSFLKLAGTTALIIGFAYAFNILAKSLKEFNDIGWDEMAKAGATMTGLVASIILLSKMTKTIKITDMIALVGTMMGIAFAMDMLSKSLQNFSKASWGDLAKAGVTLLGLGIAMAALSAVFSNPVMLAGLAAATAGILGFGLAIKLLGEGIVSMGSGLKDFSESIGTMTDNLARIGSSAQVIKDGMAILKPTMDELTSIMSNTAKAFEETLPNMTAIAESVKSISIALMTLDPKKLTELQSVITDDTVKTFADAGKAIKAMIDNFDALDARTMEAKGKGLEAIGKGVKDLAIGMWVLSKAKDLSQVTASFDAISKALTGVIGGSILTDMEKVGAGFSKMSEGIKTLTTVNPDDVGNLGPAFEKSSKGLKEWMKAFKSGGSMVADLTKTGEGFKQLAIGIWVLGKTNFDGMSDNMRKFTPQLIALLETIKKNTRVFGDSKNLTEAFKGILMAIKDFASLDRNKMIAVSQSMDVMGTSVGAWLEGIGKASGTFFKDVMKTAEAFKMMTQAISDMGGGEGDITATANAINTMKDAIVSWLNAIGKNASILKDVTAVGESFKLLSMGIEVLAQARANMGGTFGNIGKEMETMSKGIGQWMENMKKNATFNILGIGKDLEAVGDAFKGLGQGISFLADPTTIEGMKVLGAQKSIMSNMVPVIEGFLGALGKGGDNAMKGGSGFKSMAEGLVQLTGLAGTIGLLPQMASGINAVSDALSKFKPVSDGLGPVTDKFVKFLKEVRAAGPIKVDMEVPGDKTVALTPKMEELNQLSTISINIQSAFAAQTDRLVQAIDKLTTEEKIRHEERMGVLTAIANNTRRTMNNTR